MTQLFPTELIGSYALPSWLHVTLQHRAELGGDDLDESLDDAVRLAVFDQQGAGLDVITDGELRRRDFIQSFYDRLSGLRPLPPARRFGAAGYDQNPRHEVVGKITAPRGLGIVEEFLFLRTLTGAPVKMCLPGAMTLALPLLLQTGYSGKDELIEDLARIVNTEMKALVKAGATLLQIDEPRYATSDADAKKLVDLFNFTRRGVSASVGLHLCFGNFKGRSRDRRDYSTLFPAILAAECDQFNLEFANREFAQIELLKQFHADQRIGIGVVDVKSYFVETPEDVATGIRRAMQHAPAANLVITPDCGFNHCPRHIALRKIQSLVAGANLVRREIG
ncbi:MAG: methionine synthase [Planctomycetaceae bacterium]|nr:methionine synthase [Planctomycetaceae bacterium]